MSLASRIAAVLLPPVDAQQLRVSEYPSFEEQLHTIQRRAVGPKAWITPSVNEALGVPAIFGAVSLIANTVGSLSLEAWRDNVMLASGERPRLIVRPNPFSTPRAFFRDTAFYLATRGEAWWWVAARDVDGAPLSLFPIPPWEITVAQNDFNRLRPKITWGNKLLDNDDVRQITYLPAHDGLRGIGPLQANGAAVSVTVEAQEWAANFFAGSLPSIIGTTEQDMSEEELKLMDKQWLEKPSNMPRWLTNGLTLSDSPFDPQKAQLTESRNHQVGEACRMFLMPGPLVEYQMGGSSLTYQNKAEVWTDFHGRCLAPNYLEPIEQEISDLLTRSTSARFNVKQLLRGDPKTRMEVHQIAVETGVYDAQTAAREEGYEPGAVDFAPVPLSPPQAVPSLLPINRSQTDGVRCSKCHKFYADLLTPPYRFTCPRCKTVNENLIAGETRSLDAVDGMKLAIAALAQPPQVKVDVAPAQVTVEAAPPPKVYVNVQPFVDAIDDLKETLRPKPVTRIPVRDESGQIIRIVEEVA